MDDANVAQGDVHFPACASYLVADEAQRLLRDRFGLLDPRSGRSLEPELELSCIHWREDRGANLQTGEDRDPSGDEQEGRHQYPSGRNGGLNHSAERTGCPGMSRRTADFLVLEQPDA